VDFQYCTYTRDSKYALHGACEAHGYQPVHFRVGARRRVGT
jgi:hypothetical protein